ncbi:MAG: hypothetical protein ACKO2L_00360 [Planctomycetaceae bacterium]
MSPFQTSLPETDRLSRRRTLQLAAGAGLLPLAAITSSPASAQIPVKPKSVAAVITVYFRGSHADVLLTKILEGWKHDGGPGPALKLESICIDQPQGSEFGLELLRKHNIPQFRTIEQALTVGGNSIPVDGVLSIGEHGSYPINEFEQQLYPRKRFFEEITDTFRKYDKVVPVFNDKHISTVWDDAKWMYDRALQLRVPFMAGSSLPVSYRTKPLELPLDSDIEAAVGIGYSGLDVYGFHALECFQTIVERRRGAEQGVRRVRCIEGPAVWKTVEDGWVDAEVMDTVYAAVPHSKSNIREDQGATLFQFEYVDGFRGSLFMLPTAGLSGVAVRLKGQPTLATAFEERPDPSYPHFAWLLKAIETMVHRGRPQWPVERTLLTGGILDRALRSRHAGGRMLETPELQIAYKPVAYPCAPLPDLLTPP